MEPITNGKIKLFIGQILYHSEHKFYYEVVSASTHPDYWYCAVPKNHSQGLEISWEKAPWVPKILFMQHKVIVYNFEGII